MRYKEITRVYGQGGARKREVRLLVVAPVGYRTTKNGRKCALPGAQKEGTGP